MYAACLLMFVGIDGVAGRFMYGLLICAAVFADVCWFGGGVACKSQYV